METVVRHRIEIIADAPLIPRISAACTAAGIGGYSIVPLVGGAGRSGAWRAGGLTDAEAKIMFMIVASAEAATRLTDALAPTLDSHGLLLTISEVNVVRAGRFS